MVRALGRDVPIHARSPGALAAGGPGRFLISACLAGQGGLPDRPPSFRFFNPGLAPWAMGRAALRASSRDQASDLKLRQNKLHHE